MNVWIKKTKKVFLVFLFLGLFFGVFAENVYAANDCACAERVALNLYDVKSIFVAGSESTCMDKCRGNDNVFYAYPDVSSLTAGAYRLMLVDGFKYTSNCACLAGSLIPLYYPVGSLNQVSGGAIECNSVCYSKTSDYYAYEGSGLLSGWKTKVTAPVIAATDQAQSQTKHFDYQLLESFPGFFTADDKMSDLPSMILAIYKFGIWTVGIAGFFMLVVGGFMYMASAGNTSTASGARKIIADSLLGIVAALGAYLILYVINPELTKLKIDFTTVEVKFDRVDASNPSSSTKCQDCVSVADICKESPCFLNKTLAGKLRTAFQGQNARITEGWPATVNHTSSCHGNGTCADVNLTVSKGNVQDVKKLYDRIKSAGLNPVYEDTAAGCAKYTAAGVYCRPYPTMTYPSFHVNM